MSVRLGPADALTLGLTLYRQVLIDAELNRISADVSARQELLTNSKQHSGVTLSSEIVKDAA